MLEAADEHPQGSESALRELAPVLHRGGGDAAVSAFREVAPDGVLPSAPKVRRKLVAAGRVDKPERDVADGMAKRIRWLEEATPRIRPHERLRPLLRSYVDLLRVVVDQLEALAPAVPAGQPCLSHGVRRRPDGLCAYCVRPDVPPAHKR